MPGSGVGGSGLRVVGLVLEASRSTLFSLEIHTLWGLWNCTNPPPHPEAALLRLCR